VHAARARASRRRAPRAAVHERASVSTVALVVVVRVCAMACAHAHVSPSVRFARARAGLISKCAWRQCRTRSNGVYGFRHGLTAQLGGWAEAHQRSHALLRSTHTGTLVSVRGAGPRHRRVRTGAVGAIRALHGPGARCEGRDVLCAAVCVCCAFTAHKSRRRCGALRFLGADERGGCALCRYEQQGPRSGAATTSRCMRALCSGHGAI
jgi:hypothetical protein